MAIFDVLFESSDDQVVTNASAVSTNIIDMQLADLNMGAGEPIWLNIRIGTAFAGGTSLVFGLYSHSAVEVGSGTLLWATPAITDATMVAGYWIMRMPLPDDVDRERYIGLYYTTSGTHSAGTINAWLDHGPQSNTNTQVTASNI